MENNDIPTDSTNDIYACTDCDLLLTVASQPGSDNARCPRCGAGIPAAQGFSRAGDQGLSAAIAGLILFLPAATLPIMQFELVGQSDNTTLSEGVMALWRTGYPALSLVVLLCSLIAPLLHLALNTCVAVMLRRDVLPLHFPLFLKGLQWFQHWSMVEVYAISILVAYIKMLSDGDVTLMAGSYCIAGLLLALILCSRQFNAQRAWLCWETQHRCKTRTAALGPTP